jgi:hypothetical protein
MIRVLSVIGSTYFAPLAWLGWVPQRSWAVQNCGQAPAFASRRLKPWINRAGSPRGSPKGAGRESLAQTSTRNWTDLKVEDTGSFESPPNLRRGQPTLFVDYDAADAMNPGPYLVAWPTESEWRNPATHRRRDVIGERSLAARSRPDCSLFIEGRTMDSPLSGRELRF